MFSLKINQKIIIFVLIYSAIALTLHFLAIKYIYDSVGTLLSANDLAHSTEKILLKERADLLRQYSYNISAIFLIICYVFMALIGILLIIKKVNLLNYFCEIILFSLIQIVGIFILTRFINNYGMTELFGRLNVLIHQKLTIILIIVPLLISAVQALQKYHK